jgi:hypothetical protein
MFGFTQCSTPPPLAFVMDTTVDVKGWLSPLNLFSDLTLVNDHAFMLTKGPSGDVLLRVKSWPTDEVWLPHQGISILKRAPSSKPNFSVPLPYPIDKTTNTVSNFASRLDVFTRSGENALAWWREQKTQAIEAEKKECEQCHSLRVKEMESRPSRKLKASESKDRAAAHRKILADLVEHVPKCKFRRTVEDWRLVSAEEKKSDILEDKQQPENLDEPKGEHTIHESDEGIAGCYLRGTTRSIFENRGDTIKPGSMIAILGDCTNKNSVLWVAKVASLTRKTLVLWWCDGPYGGPTSTCTTEKMNSTKNSTIRILHLFTGILPCIKMEN